MPSQEYSLVFKTKKEGNEPKELSKDLKELKSGIAGAIEGLTGFSISSLGVAAAITGVGVGMKKAVDGTVEYDKQIREMQRLSGASAEESSRLIQVTDDLGVEYKDLAGALKIATKNGIEPTIGGLAKLSDQYMALAPGQERSAFLLEKFGKNGLSMAAALEKGGDALRKMNDEIDGNLVRTQEQVDQSRAYEIALDNISDRLQGYVTVIGSKLIPVFIKAFDAADKFFGFLEDKVFGGEFAKQEAQVFSATRTYEEYIAGLNEGTKATGQYINATGDLVEKFSAYGQVGERIILKNAAMTRSEYDMKFALQAVEKSSGDASRAVNDFSLSTEGAASDTAELARLMTEQTAIAAKGLALEMTNLTVQTLYANMAIGLDTDAQRALAVELGLIIPVTAEAARQMAQLKKDLDVGKISLDEYNKSARNLAQGLGLIQSKTVTIDVIYKQSGSVPGGQNYVDPGTGSGYGVTPKSVTVTTFEKEEEIDGKYASGGSYTIPPGFYEDYPVGIGKYASSGETVTITPAGKKGGGAGVYIENVILQNGMDLESFKRMLMEAMRR